MSHTSTSPPITALTARAESIGYLALTFAGKRLPLQVLCSAAGHYIGTFDDGPVSRESVEYFVTYAAARHALESDAWTPQQQP